MNKLILPILALSLVLGSCDVTSLNQNEKGAEEVPGEPLFTNAQVALGKHLNDNNINMGIYRLMAQYMTTTDYPQEPQYQLDNRTIPSNVWDDLYRDVLVDFDEAATLIKENDLLDEAVKQNQLAQIEVLEVLTYYVLVTTFGDIPFTDLDFGENSQPEYDNDEMVYASIMDSLDTAIDQFDAGAGGFDASADVFYDGNVESWVTFANSLMLRLGITVADADGDLGTRGQEAVEEAAPNAMTSNADNAMMPYQTASPHSNPLWEELVESGRDDYIPAEPLVSRMNELDDPRRPIFMTTAGSGEYEGGIYGNQNDYSAFSHFSETIEQRDRPGTIMEYAEVEFILAEAAERGYSVSGSAADHYEAAIRADMEFWGVSDSDIDAYLAQPEVAYATASGDFREKIGVQKWMALFLQGFEGWTEYRRLGFPELQAHPDAVVDQVPLRYTYPIKEQNFNKSNYDNAVGNLITESDELLTPLFWTIEY